MKLPYELLEFYQRIKSDIEKILEEYANVPKAKYFYELCYCILTPQSSAKNAFLVQEKLELHDFFNTDFDTKELLSSAEHYIRFHNQKANRLREVKEIFPDVLQVLESANSAFDKRKNIYKLVNGVGLKESSHFLRNIGYRDLAIIDRHLLKNLLRCGVIEEIPKSITEKNYYDIEEKFIKFGNYIGISIDHLDLLFWSYETGFILK